MNNINCIKFDELLLWSGLSIKETAILAGKSEKTIRKYCLTNRSCKAVRRLIEWYFHGIPQVHDWHGWKIRRGFLVAPSGYEYQARHLEMIPVLYAWIAKETKGDPHELVLKRNIR